MLRQWTFPDPKYMQDFRVLVFGQGLACSMLYLSFSSNDVSLEAGHIFRACNSFDLAIDNFNHFKPCADFVFFNLVRWQH
jgi:hypothetical protein